MTRRCLLVAIFATLCGASTARAQDQSIVFVHGLNTNGDTWKDAADRLAQDLAITPERPTLSGSSYEEQATSLQGQLWWLPHTTVAVGHSNGGVVSRHWSTLHEVSGVVTLSTPHRGAPIFAHVADWVNFNHMAFDLIGGIGAAFGMSYDDTWWVFAAIQGILSLSTQSAQDAILQLAGILGLQHWLPIFPQMIPGSAYLQQLNSQESLAREAGAVPSRVGIVNVAENFYRGGVFRAIWPERGDTISDIIHSAAAVLDYYALDLMTSTNPRDWRRAQTLGNLAWWLWVHEEIWCRTISDPSPYAYSSSGFCAENDTVVPTWSQVYPGAANIERRNTPAHTQQTTAMAATIYEVLTSFAHVRPRGELPPGDNPPGPPPPAHDDTLAAGEVLWPGQDVTSADGRFALTYQADGNLVLYRNDGRPLWASQTAGTRAGRAVMQPDGNFGVFDVDGAPVWTSRTEGRAGAVLTVQTDGNVVIYTPDGTPIWTTGTAGW